MFRSRVVPLEAPAAAERASGGEPLGGSELDAWLGDVQIRLHRWKEARERLEGALAADPKAARALAELALVDLADQKPERAWDEFARAAALAPDDFFVQYLYGSTLLADAREETLMPEEQNARAAKAYAALARAAALGPAWMAASERKGEAAAFDPARLAEARTLLTEAAAAAPGRLEYVVRLAQVCVQQDDMTEARRLLTGLSGATWNPPIARWARDHLDTLDESENVIAAARRAREGAGSEDGQPVAGDAARRRAGRGARIRPAREHRVRPGWRGLAPEGRRARNRRAERRHQGRRDDVVRPGPKRRRDVRASRAARFGCI